MHVDFDMVLVMQSLLTIVGAAGVMKLFSLNGLIISLTVEVKNIKEWTADHEQSEKEAHNNLTRRIDELQRALLGKYLGG